MVLREGAQGDKLVLMKIGDKQRQASVRFDFPPAARPAHVETETPDWTLDLQTGF
jgi:hypothetical protein